MRSNVTEYEMIAPRTLEAALQTMAAQPGEYLPVAGGTEVMVMLGVGKLAAKKLISLGGLKELRFITASEGSQLDGQHCQPESGDAGRQPGECLARGRFTAGLAGV